MKTNEEKLKQLLTIAVENGWYSDVYNEIKSGRYKLYDKSCHWFSSIDGILSINDFVTNWEEGEVSFIEALCKHCQKTMNKEDFVKWSNSFRTHIDFYFEHEELEFLWNFKIDKKQRIDKRPTSERLNWLFETFKHLL